MRCFKYGFFAVAFSVTAFFTTMTAGMAQSDDIRVLTIANAEKTLASYSPADLQKAFLPHEIETIIPWLKPQGKFVFRGPFLKDVMARHGLENRDIEAIAFDEYRASISSTDIDTYSPIIATEIGCQDADYKSGLCEKDQKFRELRQEENGFFRLIWPANQLPKTSSENDPRWIWALVVLRSS